MKVLKEIISTVNNAEFDSKGDPMYSYTQLEDCMKEYAKQVGEQVREDCAKNAKMVYHCGHTKANTPSVHRQVGADNIKIDKQSILSTEIKLP